MRREISRSLLGLDFVSPDFLQAITPDTEQFVLANVMRVTDDAYTKTQRSIDEVGSWADLSEHEKRAFLLLLYITRGELSHATDDIFGDEVLMLLMGPVLRARRYGVFFYINGAFLRKEKIPYFAMDIIKKNHRISYRCLRKRDIDMRGYSLGREVRYVPAAVGNR